MLITGDFNAINVLWKESILDDRSEDDLDSLMVNDLCCRNASYRAATFETINGHSWIDLTLEFLKSLHEWKVSETESFSDHRYLLFNLVNTFTLVNLNLVSLIGLSYTITSETIHGLNIQCMVPHNLIRWSSLLQIYSMKRFRLGNRSA